MMRGCKIMAALAALALAGTVQAQTPPATTASFVCPTTDVMTSPKAVELRELLLKPGGKIEPSVFLKDPRTAAFVADMTKQTQSRQQVDYSGLCHYRAANAALRGKRAPTTVFLGDSITENWAYGDVNFFSDRILDRGISGQTSSQILLRFYPDVVELNPTVVHILAGTNDILQNKGPVGDDDIVNNINAMIDIAKAHGISVVLAAIPPISVRSWQPDLVPAARLAQLNDRLRAMARFRSIAFADYFVPLKDAAGGLDPKLGNDGVHPNRDGYAVMKPIALDAIARAQK